MLWNISLGAPGGRYSERSTGPQEVGSSWPILRWAAELSPSRDSAQDFSLRTWCLSRKSTTTQPAWQVKTFRSSCFYVRKYPLGTCTAACLALQGDKHLTRWFNHFPQNCLKSKMLWSYLKSSWVCASDSYLLRKQFSFKTSGSTAVVPLWKLRPLTRKQEMPCSLTWIFSPTFYYISDNETRRIMKD